MACKLFDCTQPESLQCSVAEPVTVTEILVQNTPSVIMHTALRSLKAAGTNASLKANDTRFDIC